MSDPEITENVIDNGEEYTLKNRIDTDKVFKKRPVQGKVTTETPDVIMPVVEEVKEPEANGTITIPSTDTNPTKTSNTNPTTVCEKR